jgi:hypothetical protein
MTKERQLLEHCRLYLSSLGRIVEHSAVSALINNINELLAQPKQEKQEPVAWMTTFKNGGLTDDPYYANHKDYTPLYLAPPKREPLSDDEIFNIGYNAGFTLDHVKNDDGSVYGFLNEYGYIDNNPYFKFVRAIEKEHGIGVENE